MANTLGKARDKNNPYATFKSDHGGFVWHVLKTYKLPKNENEHARWFCFVTSPMCPDGEYGDVYKNDVKTYGRLESASDEWKQAYA